MNKLMVNDPDPVLCKEIQMDTIGNKAKEI